MDFPLIPKVMTLNDSERRNILHYLTVEDFGTKLRLTGCS